MASDDGKPGDEKSGAGTQSLGAGAEAAAGVHAQHGTTAAGAKQAENADARPASAQGTDRSGSEPLDRTHEHKGGYGGEGGKPRGQES